MTGGTNGKPLQGPFPQKRGNPNVTQYPKKYLICLMGIEQYINKNQMHKKNADQVIAKQTDQ
jgi:hypothetical protein